jgi:ABC-type lipoprotein export system ATPase subunit
MITLKNLTKVYETVNYNIIALQDINYQLDKGEVVVLLGKSGSGKSTLLNILGGFDRNYVGHYILDGEDMKEKSEREIDLIRKRKIGFVFQHYVLLNNLTVLENVELAMRVIGVVHDKSRRRAAMHALKLVGLENHTSKYPYELSGGQKQRVAIARAFVKNPDIIIADEPTAALDSRTSNEILELLKDLCRTKLLIIATHNKAIVRDFGTRVIELKSGYTLRDELITDRSKVRVDELDLIIDQEIGEKYSSVEELIDIEEHLSVQSENTVLKDLGVNLSGFKVNKQENMSVDEELKRSMIKERIKNSKLQTRIYRFLQTSDDFFGKKNYANKSFFRNIGLHVFSAMIFTVFLLTIVFGFNFVTETFGGFNEKAMYIRNMNNHSVVLFPPVKYDMIDDEQTMYEEMGNVFIRDFSQTEINKNRFYNNLLKDPYYVFDYNQKRLLSIASELTKIGGEDKLDLYYNNSSVILKIPNNDIVFDSLKYKYQNIITNPQPFVYLSSFLDTPFDTNQDHLFDFIYSENNYDILKDHLLEGGKLPDKDNEVVIPVSYLFKYEILHTSDFKDEHGNILEVIPSEAINQAFFNLPEEKRTITITKSILSFLDDGISYTMDTSTEAHNFKVVGLVNFGGDINPYIDFRDDVYFSTGSAVNYSFIFSKKAESYLNFDIIDNATIGDFQRVIQYATISKEDALKYDLKAIESKVDSDYLDSIKTEFTNAFSLWINTLNSATADVAVFVHDDLEGKNPSTNVLNEFVDPSLFPGLKKGDILAYYVAQHMNVIGDEEEFHYLCSSCDINNRSFSTLLLHSQDAYEKLKQSSEYVDVLENFGDVSRLTYQESTNRLIYEYYGDRFNNQFYETEKGNTYSLELISPFEEQSGSILSLLEIFLPRTFLESIPFFQTFVESLSALDNNEHFISFLQSTNLDLLISSITTNAVRSVVLVVLYIIVYILLILSVFALGAVLINLYGNIYETATRRRIRELASLRILGTSYKDILSMIKLENRRVALLSYAAFIVVLYLLSGLQMYSVSSIKHFFMPVLGLFFDFNVYNIFATNRFVLILVTLVFYLFIYKFVINRVSTRKIKNIDTIKAIRDGDNL